MHPRLPLVGLPTYGLLIAIGLVAGLVLAWHVAKRRGLPPEDVQDVIVWASLWGLVGARVLLVLLEPRTFIAAPWQILFQGGVFYGGLGAGAVGGWLRCRRLGLDPWRIADVMAPCLALAHAFGRVGCLMAGCCWGSECSLPWAIVYSDPRSMALLSGMPLGQHVHPTQLYEALGDLALVAVTLAIGARLERSARPAWRGAAWWTYVASYAVLRFAVETVRGDDRGQLFGLSTSQWLALAALGATLVALVVRLRRRAGSAGAIAT